MEKLSPEDEIRINGIKSEMTNLFWNNYDRLNYPVVKITEEEFAKLDRFAWQVAKYKKKEKAKHYKDKKLVWLHNTFLIGICSEWGVLKYTKHKWEDLNIGIGRVKTYNEADLKYAGLPYGIKSGKIGNPPMVYPDHKQDEIICAVTAYGHLNEDEDYVIDRVWKVYICGIATAEIIRKYQSPDYIINKDLNQSKVKNGFYGYDYLYDLSNLYIDIALRDAGII